MNACAIASVDWLALSCRFIGYWGGDYPPPFTPAGYRLAREGETPVFYHRLVLYWQGDKVATIMYSPKSKLIKAESVLIEMANKVLYAGDYSIHKEAALRVFNVMVVGLSRVDLCIDFPLTNFNIIHEMARGDVYVAKKRMGSLFWDTDEAGNRLAHQIAYGSKNSSMKWKVYYKYKELMEGGTCSKPYIIERWRDYGLDVQKVWRVEVSIQDSNRYKWRGEAITLEVVEEHCPEIAADLYVNNFVCRRNEGHTDRRNDTRVYLFEPDRQPVKGWTYKRPMASEPRDVHVTTLRTLYGLLDKNAVLMDEVLVVELLNTMANIIETNHLHQYFEKMADMPFEEYSVEKLNPRFSPLASQS